MRLPLMCPRRKDAVVKTYINQELTQSFSGYADFKGPYIEAGKPDTLSKKSHSRGEWRGN